MSAKMLKCAAVWGILITFCTAQFGCVVKPNPYTNHDFKIQSEKNLQKVYAEQEVPGKPIDLYEAMARAVKYNYDHRIKILEETMAKENLIQSNYDLLPQIVASAGYTSRNNENGSVSSSLLTGNQSLEASTSQEKRSFTANIITVWNILDFGVGYHQARQIADEVLIAEEQRRRAVQNIVQDVRYAYWRAVSAEQLLPEMDQLLAQVSTALERYKAMEKTGADSPMKLLDYQQELLETVQRLWSMRKDLAMAKTELANLMNLKPGLDYQISIPKEQKAYFPLFGIKALEAFALTRRPEIRSEAYQQRISALEVKKSMLRMLPGLELNLSSNYDDNKYLYNSSWIQAGMNLSLNIFQMFRGPANIRNAKIQELLANERSFANAMLVLTQTHLANQQYQISLREFEIANNLDQVHRRKLYHAEMAQKANTGNQMEEIQKKSMALSARMQLGMAYAELQAAVGRIYHSIGSDPLPPTISRDTIPYLALVMKKFEKRKERRLLGTPPQMRVYPNPFLDPEQIAYTAQEALQHYPAAIQPTEAPSAKTAARFATKPSTESAMPDRATDLAFEHTYTQTLGQLGDTRGGFFRYARNSIPLPAAKNSEDDQMVSVQQPVKNTEEQKTGTTEVHLAGDTIIPGPPPTLSTASKKQAPTQTLPAQLRSIKTNLDQKELSEDYPQFFIYQNKLYQKNPLTKSIEPHDLQVAAMPNQQGETKEQTASSRPLSPPAIDRTQASYPTFILTQGTKVVGGRMASDAR